MKTPNDAVKMGGYITIPPVKEKRWDVISGYIKLFNFQIGAELGVADAVNFFRPILFGRENLSVVKIADSFRSISTLAHPN